MPERPQSDPPTDSLTTLAEAERDAALRRFPATSGWRARAATGTSGKGSTHEATASGALLKAGRRYPGVVAELVDRRRRVAELEDVLRGVVAAEEAAGRAQATRAQALAAAREVV